MKYTCILLKQCYLKRRWCIPSTVDVQLTVVKIHALTGSFAGYAAARRWDVFVPWTGCSGNTDGSPTSKVLPVHANLWSLPKLPPQPYQWLLVSRNVWHLSLGGYDCSLILCCSLIVDHPCQTGVLTVIFSCFNFFLPCCHPFGLAALLVHRSVCMGGYSSYLWKPLVRFHQAIVRTEPPVSKILHYKADEASHRDLMINTLASASLKEWWIQALHNTWDLLLLKGSLRPQALGPSDELDFCLKSQNLPALAVLCGITFPGVWAGGKGWRRWVWWAVGWIRCSGFLQPKWFYDLKRQWLPRRVDCWRAQVQHFWLRLPCNSYKLANKTPG